MDKRSGEYGANEQRKTIKRKIKEMIKKSDSEFINGEELLEWIKLSDERYQKRKGGLGK